MHEIVELFGLTSNKDVALKASRVFEAMRTDVQLDETPHEAAWRLAKEELGPVALESAVQVDQRVEQGRKVFTYAVGVAPCKMVNVKKGIQWFNIKMLQACMEHMHATEEKFWLPPSFAQKMLDRASKEPMLDTNLLPYFELLVEYEI